MWPSLLLGACVVYLVLEYTRTRRYSPIVRRVIRRLGSTSIDYGIVPREGFHHPIVRWGRIRDVVARIHRDRDIIINMKLTSPEMLERIGLSGRDALRIQSPDYHEGLHFDCYGQRITQIQGRKRWILFDMSFDTVQEKHAFVIKWWKHTGIDDLASHLSDRGVPYDIVDLTPGKSLTIPIGRMHQTEGIGDDVSILVNTELPCDRDMQKRCDREFETVFPRQMTACSDNDCRY